MQSLPAQITITDDQGANPITLSTGFSRDVEDDRIAAKVLKATEMEDRGVFQNLWQGTRHYMVTSGFTKEARLLEALYQSGYPHGYITVRDAVVRLEPIMKPHCKDFSMQVRRLLEGVSEFLEAKRADFQNVGLGELFTKSPTRILVGENVNNSPRSHKKGQGSGARRGPKEKAYWIPPKYMLDYTFGKHDKRRLAIPVRALGCNRTYAAYVGKVDVAEKTQIKGRQIDLAAYMLTSRKTMKERMELAGCRVRPQTKLVELKKKRVQALPKNKLAMDKVRKSGEQRFRRVQDKDGKWAYANLADMRAKGLDLEGKIFAEICVGTVVTDEDFDAWLVKGDANESGILRVG